MAGEGEHPIEELLPAYALNALEPTERQQVEAHLAECDRCTAALERYLEVTAAVSVAHEAVAPSEALRQRVLGAAARSARARTGAAAPRWRLAPWRRAPAWAWAAAAALALVVAGLSTVLATQGGRLSDMEQKNQELKVQIQEQRAVS